MDNIKILKEIASIEKTSREKAKQTKCYLCCTEQTSFCNSHSIPKFILRNIAEKGIVLATYELIELPIDDEIGINKAGTFRLICNKCDSVYFSDYEDEKKLKTDVTNKCMAEIALKNYLLEIYKKYILQETLVETQLRFNRIYNREEFDILN